MCLNMLDPLWLQKEAKGKAAALSNWILNFGKPGIGDHGGRLLLGNEGMKLKVPLRETTRHGF